MKKELIISSFVALLCLPIFGGCKKETTSSQNSSLNNSANKEAAMLQEMLKDLREGFSLEGTVKHRKNILDGYYGNPTGEVIDVTYEAEFVYEVSAEKGYSSYIVSKQDGKKDIVVNDIQVFEGSDGYAYFYELNYDNTVKKYPIIGNQSYEKVNFGYYCMNPFEYLLPSDFTKVNDTTYTLTKTKASFFASSVLIDVSSAFTGLIETCEFVIDNGVLKSFKVIPTKFHDQFTNVEQQTTVYYYGEYLAEFNFGDIGNAEVKKVTAREKQENSALLQAALDKYTNNFTANMVLEFYDEGEKFGEHHSWYYYDGETLYFSAVEDQSEHDPVNNLYFEQLPDNTPIISGVNADIFDYDAERDVYTICDEMVSYIGAIALIPPLNVIYNELNGYTTSLEIKLSNDGYIEYIEFTYSYDHYSYIEDGEGRIEFHNVGTTVMPHPESQESTEGATE